MARVPSQLTALLDSLSEQLPLLLGRNLVGIYLYGSLTQRAFNPKRSDVDCIVVTRRKVTGRQFTQIRSWFAAAAKSNPWVLRLQASFLIRNRVLVANSEACSYQFGRLSRYRSDGKEVVVSTHEPTRVLHELTAQALAEGRELEGLSVRRPSLEEVYLALTAEDE